MRALSSLAEYPFEPQTLDIDGQAMSYLDIGEGMPVVMIHGNPSWSYLYRNLVSTLKDRYRCIVPDHIGCGLSAKPQNYPYLLKNHIDNLEALLDHLQITRCVLVVHDWGGAIGMGWAGRHSHRIAGLVVLNTAAFRSARIPFRIAVCRWPYLGPLLVQGCNGFAGAAVHMAVHKKMRPEIAAGFLAPYDTWHNRVAVHRFVRDIPLDSDHPSWDTLVAVEAGLDQFSKTPMLICWGGRDFCFNDHFYKEWKKRFPKADAHYFADAGHYVLEDAYPEILPLIERFLDRQGGSNGEF